MVEHLDALGIDSVVFAPTDDKKAAVIRPNSNVVVAKCFTKWDRFFFSVKQAKIMRAVKKNIDIKKFDIIHAYTVFTDGNCARKLSKKYGIPYVVAVRNTDVNDFFRLMPHLRSKGISILCDASAIFFLSEEYKKQVFEKYIPVHHHAELECKTFIVPNGIDDYWQDNIFLGKKRTENRIKLIYAGRVDRNKNIQLTQRAMRILIENGIDVSLTVVGKIADKKEYSVIVADKNTTYISAKPKEELIELYRKHDIFVMPSHTETFGLVYAEAMSQGLPVIYTKGQGFDGQFPEGVVGYHVSDMDEKNMARAINLVTREYEKISSACVSNVDRFKWNEICNIYIKIYEESICR